MYWKDEGYLLSKSNYSENSIMIETFTLNHGKCSGIVYGGSSRKHKKNFQLGNKILLNWKSKGENKMGYFSTELIKPISPLFFHDKRKTICILSATSILKILLPERQINKNIYLSFEQLTGDFHNDDWIKMYIFWELSLIKNLGFEINLINYHSSSNKKDNKIEINNKFIKIPNLILNENGKNFSKDEIREALIFNRSLLMENFILPNRLRFPTSRNILEKYYN